MGAALFRRSFGRPRRRFDVSAGESGDREQCAARSHRSVTRAGSKTSRSGVVSASGLGS